jgi:cytochrome c553
MTNLPTSAVLLAALTAAAAAAAADPSPPAPAVQAPAAQAPDFSRDVAPVLRDHCLRCHQPGRKKGGLSLATPRDLIDGGHLVPGRPGESGLLEMVVAAPGELRPHMPAEGAPLTADQVAVLRRWIAAGAVWPDGLVLRETSKADRSWWSLRPLSQPQPPSPPGLPAGWDAHPIDRFVAAALAAKGLSPSPPAPRRVLIRRATYDLTGLPPTPEEVEAFVGDPLPDDPAFAKVVDRLLASPHYGERWGRHWLDVVRFGESTGYERNVIIDSAWPFRDYVIRSFNDDKPFDRLVAEHLAGDVLAPGDPDVEIGTAFLVCGPYDNVGNQDAVQATIIRADTLDDMIRATGEAFLGVTIGCARCHDHKFDPIPQTDYYRLSAAFAGVRHGTRIIGPPEQRRRLEEVRARFDKAGADRRALEDAVAARAERSGRAAELKLAPGLPRTERRRRLVEAEATAAEKARLAEIDKARADVAAELAALPKPREWWAGTFRPAPPGGARVPGRGPAEEGRSRPVGEPLAARRRRPGIRTSRRPRAPTPPGAGPVADGSRQSAHPPRAGQPALAVALRHRDRGHAGGLRLDGRPADAPGAAGLAGRPAARRGLAAQAPAPARRLTDVHGKVIEPVLA